MAEVKPSSGRVIPDSALESIRLHHRMSSLKGGRRTTKVHKSSRILSAPYPRITQIPDKTRWSRQMIVDKVVCEATLQRGLSFLVMAA